MANWRKLHSPAALFGAGLALLALLGAEMAWSARVYPFPLSLAFAALAAVSAAGLAWAYARRAAAGRSEGGGDE